MSSLVKINEEFPASEHIVGKRGDYSNSLFRWSWTFCFDIHCFVTSVIWKIPVQWVMQIFKCWHILLHNIKKRKITFVNNAAFTEMSLDSKKIVKALVIGAIQVLQFLIIKRILEFYHWLKIWSTVAFDVICSLHFFWIKHLPNSYSWKAILSKLLFEQKQCSMKKVFSSFSRPCNTLAT